MPVKNPSPALRWKWNLSWKYGLTPEGYDRMMSDQGGKCAICEVRLTVKKPRVDHCHTTGKVRGILCHHCNLKLAVVEEPGFVEKARAYLSKPSIADTRWPGEIFESVQRD